MKTPSEWAQMYDDLMRDLNHPYRQESDRPMVIRYLTAAYRAGERQGRELAAEVARAHTGQAMHWLDERSVGHVIADAIRALPEEDPGRIHFKCPKCEREHDRGYFNAVSVFRCMNCGYVGPSDQGKESRAGMET